MKHFKFILKLTLIITALNIFIAQNAYAYVDPGTGSYMFQMAIATILGASFTIKSYWHKINNFISRLFNKVNKEIK